MTQPAAPPAASTASGPVLVLVPGIIGIDALVGAEAPFALADPAEPHLRVTDLGVTRGEGAFETIGVFDGRPMAMDAHLARLQRSADMMDMPRLDLEVLERAVRAGIEAHEAVPEMLARVFVTPGLEGAAPGAGAAARPTAWVHVKASPDYSAPRAGIRVLALDRGIPSTAPATSPWLLAGAKSLSYAINMAAQREAERRGADDVLFVSSDGHVLEGPTSTLLVRRGERFTTVPASAGVLPGTSQAAIFAALRAEGAECTEEMMTPADVAAADGAWLVASGRLAAPITHLDDRELPVDRELSGRLCAIISGRVPSEPTPTSRR